MAKHRTKSRLRALLVGGILGVAASPAQTAPLGTHQLLRFHSVVYDFQDGQTYDDEFVLFRDGEVFGRLQTRAGLRYQRFRMAESELLVLKQALVRERAGLSPPACHLADFLPHTASFRGSLTWFGKGNRAVHTDFGDPEGTGESCSESVERLTAAVYDALARLPGR